MPAAHAGPTSEPLRSPVEVEEPPEPAPATEVPVDVEPAAPPKAPVEPEVVGPTLPKFPLRDAPYKVLILGDSMAATDFGKALQTKLDRHPSVSVARRGKSATGLARPDYFDWMAESNRRIKRHDPDLVVVVIGGNDGQDLQHLKKGPRRVFWKSAPWAEAYAARVRDFCQNMLAEHRRVLWLELPVMDRRRLEKKLELIRAVQRETLDGMKPRVQYVETRRHFIEDDKILKRVTVKGYRRPQVLRQEDGIHFTVPGSRYFADRVAPEVLAALGVEAAK